MNSFVSSTCTYFIQFVSLSTGSRARYNATWEIVTHLRFVPPQDPVRLLSSAFLYAQLCVSPRRLPLLLLGTGKNPAIVCSWLQFNFVHNYCFDSQICAWLQRRSMKSHYIYTSCSSEMFREVLLLLCDTVGLCVRVPVWCAWFMCALKRSCLPCWMLASSLFVCVVAALTTPVSGSCFSLLY